MQLRPIQQEAKEAILSSFKKGGTYHLAVEPVSFGKTILASALMETALMEHGAKCLFLAHLQELVLQTHDKFVKVAPHLAHKVGIYHAGSNRKEVADITIGSRQSVARGLSNFDSMNLIIIDEVHLLSDEGEYDAIIDHFLSLNPRLRVLGVTGTPFRLKTGMIYGQGKRFSEPCHRTTMKDMIDVGYLSPFRYKMKVDSQLLDELEQVKVVGGEYNNGQLGDVVSEPIHMKSVLRAIEEYGSDRKHIIVFATNIAHAESLSSVLGYKCVHSQLDKHEIRKRIDDFKEGRERILVNVNVLSIGFDAPLIDCIVLARPTLSPAVYVQQIGRSLRRHVCADSLYEKYLQKRALAVQSKSSIGSCT